MLWRVRSSQCFGGSLWREKADIASHVLMGATQPCKRTLYSPVQFFKPLPGVFGRAPFSGAHHLKLDSDVCFWTVQYYFNPSNI